MPNWVAFVLLGLACLPNVFCQASLDDSYSTSSEEDEYPPAGEGDEFDFIEDGSSADIFDDRYPLPKPIDWSKDERQPQDGRQEKTFEPAFVGSINKNALQWHASNVAESSRSGGTTRSAGSVINVLSTKTIERVPYKFAFIVVGGGTSGLAAASSLAGMNDSFFPPLWGARELPKRTVLVLERGPEKSEKAKEFDAKGDLLNDTNIVETIRTADGVLLKQAKVVGGGSTISRGWVGRGISRFMNDLECDYNLSSNFVDAAIDTARARSGYPWVQEDSFGRALERAFANQSGEAIIFGPNTCPVGIRRPLTQKTPTGMKGSEVFLTPEPEDDRKFNVTIEPNAEVQKILFHYVEGEGALYADCVVYRVPKFESIKSEVLNTFVPYDTPEAFSMGRRLQDITHALAGVVDSYVGNIQNLFGTTQQAPVITDTTVIPESVIPSSLLENPLGVTYTYKKVCVETSTTRKGRVVLAAGAIWSPTILMRSGIGPAEELEARGIPVILNMPRIGQGLQDPPSISINAVLNPGVEAANQVSSATLATAIGRGKCFYKCRPFCLGVPVGPSKPERPSPTPIPAEPSLPGGRRLQPGRRSYCDIINVFASKPGGKAEVDLILSDQQMIVPMERGTAKANELTALLNSCPVSKEQLVKDLSSIPVELGVLSDVLQKNNCPLVQDLVKCLRRTVRLTTSVKGSKRGTVTLDDEQNPVVDFKYFRKGKYMKRAARGAKHLREIVKDSSLKPLINKDSDEQKKCARLLGSLAEYSENLRSDLSEPGIVGHKNLLNNLNPIEFVNSLTDSIVKGKTGSGNPEAPIYFPPYTDDKDDNWKIVRNTYTSSHAPQGSIRFGENVTSDCELKGPIPNIRIVDASLFKNAEADQMIAITQTLGIYCGAKAVLNYLRGKP